MRLSRSYFLYEEENTSIHVKNSTKDFFHFVFQCLQPIWLTEIVDFDNSLRPISLNLHSKQLSHYANLLILSCTGICITVN